MENFFKIRIYSYWRLGFWCWDGDELIGRSWRSALGINNHGKERKKARFERERCGVLMQSPWKPQMTLPGVLKQGWAPGFLGRCGEGTGPSLPFHIDEALDILALGRGHVCGWSSSPQPRPRGLRAKYCCWPHPQSLPPEGWSGQLVTAFTKALFTTLQINLPFQS